MDRIISRPVFAFVGISYVVFVLLCLSGLALLGGPNLDVRDFIAALLFSVAAALILAISLIVLHIPVLKAVKRQLDTSRMKGATIGAGLALVPFAVSAVIFSDGDSLTNLLAWALRLPGELIVNLIPYLLAGGLFGWLYFGAERPQRAA